MTNFKEIVMAIKEVKELLWAGKLQKDISQNTGFHQGDISKIKTGEIGFNVPWPDGSTGEMPEERMQYVRDKRKKQRIREQHESGKIEIINGTTCKHHKIATLPVNCDPLVKEIYKELINQEITWEQFEKRSGMQARTLFDWRKGKRKPSLFLLQVAAETVGLELELVKKKP